MEPWGRGTWTFLGSSEWCSPMYTVYDEEGDGRPAGVSQCFRNHQLFSYDSENQYTSKQSTTETIAQKLLIF